MTPKIRPDPVSCTGSGICETMMGIPVATTRPSLAATLLFTGAPVGMLAALFVTPPNEYGPLRIAFTGILTTILAGSGPALVLWLSRSGRAPGTLILALLASMFSSVAAAVVARVIYPATPWRALPPPPATALSLAGPTCYDHDRTVVFILTERHDAYTYNPRIPTAEWLPVDSVPTAAMGLLCPETSPEPPNHPAPLRSMTVSEEGAHCSSTVHFRLTGSGIVEWSVRNGCQHSILAAALIGGPISLVLVLLTWLVRPRARTRQEL